MARWQSANVLEVTPDTRRVWHFEARRDTFVPDGQVMVPAGKPLPASTVGKTWRSLVRKKLNIAWLPPEQVFLRVVQLPAASFDETLAMVELQLEKLSPVPLTQVVWSLHLLPQTSDGQQSLIVVITSREVVEGFLGKLEEQGFLADRLEVSILDQLQPPTAEGETVCIYPETVGGMNTALVAWWGGGDLQHLGLVSAPPGPKRGEVLCAQLSQMAWAGEIEGWLKGAPRLQLIARKELAAEWEPLLRVGLRETVDVQEPPSPVELAAATARRAAVASPKGALLPPEYVTRYQQQLVDRLWMRGLGAVVGLYVIGVVIYLGIAQVQGFRAGRIEAQVNALGPAYTNALQLKARYQVLRDRQELKFAALDCWKAVADHLPEGVVLNGLDLVEGRKLTLTGNAPAEMATNITAFNDQLRKLMVNGQPYFTKFEQPNLRLDPTKSSLSWNFSCELNRAEVP